MFNETMKDVIKAQIKCHPDYCRKFYGIEVIMSDSENNREEIISALKETVDQSIQRSVVIGTRIACRFADSIATSPISGFDTESIEKIQKIISFVEQSDDTYFIFAFAKENIGHDVTEYYAPHVFVVDISREDHPIHSIGFDGSKFCIKDIDDYMLYADVYEAMENLSVGETFTYVPEMWHRGHERNDFTRMKSVWLSEKTFRNVCLAEVDLESLDYGRFCDKDVPEVKSFLETVQFDDIIKCKDCGKHFILSEQNKDWFRNHNMDYPKRCECCRHKRRYQRV